MLPLNETYITPYTKEIHNKAAKMFDCGNDGISNFIRQPKSLDPAFGKTFVWIVRDTLQIIGYYNIEMSYLESDYDNEPPVKLGGAAHINYFAIDKKWQGKFIMDGVKFSDSLLMECIGKIIDIRENHIGCSFITLFSTEAGKNLYLRNEFYCAEDEEMTSTPNTAEKGGGILMYYAFDDE